ncbi:hypothetical protein ASPTUDRAFT_39559, partial [Aspergillus tubingensis CBS 134.48]
MKINTNHSLELDSFTTTPYVHAYPPTYLVMFAYFQLYRSSYIHGESTPIPNENQRTDQKEQKGN